MGRLLIILVFSGTLILALHGCGGGSDSGSIHKAIAEDPDNAPQTTGDADTGNSEEPGYLGAITDLGDLVEPQGDHWYYTKAAAINDAGIVIGQSNAGRPIKAAFMWDPATGERTFLGIHSGTYDDYYGINFERADPPKYFRYSEAVDINQSGVIIGNSTTGTGWPDDEEKRAFIWKDGVVFDLAPPPYNTEVGDEVYRVSGSYSEAVDINEKGEVLFTMDDERGRHAYYWDGISFKTDTLKYFNADGPTGPVEAEVPVLIGLGQIGGEDAEAVAINENGQAVVNSGGTAVFTDLNWGVIESLNYLPGATATTAVDINDSIPTGHIIGNSGNQGFFWDGGAMYPIAHLGGGASEAADINNLDQVVGNASTEDGSIHAILWTLGADKEGIIQDLGTLGGTNSYALAINEAGQVVGYSETGEFYEEEGVNMPIRHAFLWDKGVMYDFPFIPPYPFSEAVAVNASGEVAGNSITINAHSRGFFLAPAVP